MEYEENMNEVGNENISIAKKKEFGSACMMLGLHYTLMENIPPSEICAKINAQSYDETVAELERTGIMEKWKQRMGK
jgi:hypothetical protein